MREGKAFLLLCKKGREKEQIKFDFRLSSPLFLFTRKKKNYSSSSWTKTRSMSPSPTTPTGLPDGPSSTTHTRWTRAAAAFRRASPREAPGVTETSLARAADSSSLQVPPPLGGGGRG